MRSSGRNHLYKSKRFLFFAGRREVKEIHRLLRKCIDKTRDPTLCAHGDGFDNAIVDTNQDFESRIHDRA